MCLLLVLLSLHSWVDPFFFWSICTFTLHSSTLDSVTYSPKKLPVSGPLFVAYRQSYVLLVCIRLNNVTPTFPTMLMAVPKTPVG